MQIDNLTSNNTWHIRLSHLKRGSGRMVCLDFAHNAWCNDDRDTPLGAGPLSDDLFSFVELTAESEVALLIDEEVLYDAGQR